MRARPTVGIWHYVRVLAALGGGYVLGSGGCQSEEPAPAEVRLVGVADAGKPADARSDLPDGAAVRCAPGMTLIPAGAGVTADFCIDRYEAATATLLPDGSPATHPFDQPVDGLIVHAVVPAVASGQKPQAYISGAQARAACTNSGKHLCSAAQWLRACRGPHNNVYPYGNTYQKGVCNEGRLTNPVNDCFGGGSSVFTYAHMNSPCCVSLPSTVAVGGAFARCQSDYGVYDLHGNLHEWVEETTADGHGVFRGGFFVDAKINGAGCGYRTSAHAPTYHDYSTGFRCCSDAR